MVYLGVRLRVVEEGFESVLGCGMQARCQPFSFRAAAQASLWALPF